MAHLQVGTGFGLVGLNGHPCGWCCFCFCLCWAMVYRHAQEPGVYDGRTEGVCRGHNRWGERQGAFAMRNTKHPQARSKAAFSLESCAVVSWGIIPGHGHGRDGGNFSWPCHDSRTHYAPMIWVNPWRPWMWICFLVNYEKNHATCNAPQAQHIVECVGFWSSNGGMGLLKTSNLRDSRWFYEPFTGDSCWVYHIDSFK